MLGDCAHVTHDGVERVHAQFEAGAGDTRMTMEMCYASPRRLPMYLITAGRHMSAHHFRALWSLSEDIIVSQQAGSPTPVEGDEDLRVPAKHFATLVLYLQKTRRTTQGFGQDMVATCCLHTIREDTLMHMFLSACYVFVHAA